MTAAIPQRGATCLVAVATGVLPDGNGGFGPCPDLLTDKEAVRYLRLDQRGMDKGLQTLRYYCGKGLLRGTQVGRWKRFIRSELDRFLRELAEREYERRQRRATGA